MLSGLENENAPDTSKSANTSRPSVANASDCRNGRSKMASRARSSPTIHTTVSRSSSSNSSALNDAKKASPAISSNSGGMTNPRSVSNRLRTSDDV